MDLILNSPTPSSKKEVQAFLGLLNYYHRFLPHISSVLKPLHDLVGKTSIFEWSADCEKAFQKAKNLMKNAHILVPFDPENKTLIAVDASPHSCGAVLLQEIDSVEQAVQFASCTLSKTQQKYSQLEKEALAIIYGVTKFH